MVIYDEKLTADLGAKVKKGLWLGIVPFAVSLLLSVGLCFLLDENNSNATPLHVGAVAISLISGWYFLTVLLVFVLPNAKAGKRAYRLISAVKKQAEGTVVNMSEVITLRNGVTALEVLTDCGGKQRIFYYDLRFGEPSFVAGDLIKVTTADNFIFSYEVTGSEKKV